MCSCELCFRWSVLFAVIVAVIAGTTLRRLARASMALNSTARLPRRSPICTACRRPSCIVPPSPRHGLRAGASCQKGGGLEANSGPGNDWRCVVTWRLPGSAAVGQAIYQLDVNPDGRYVADGDGPQELNGFFQVQTVSRECAKSAVAVRRVHQPVDRYFAGVIRSAGPPDTAQMRPASAPAAVIEALVVSRLSAATSESCLMRSTERPEAIAQSVAALLTTGSLRVAVDLSARHRLAWAGSGTRRDVAEES